MTRLRELGYRVLMTPTEGRSASVHDAKIIDTFLRTELGAQEEFIVVAYSKGVSDFLEALAMSDTPPWVSRARARSSRWSRS